MHSPNDRSLSVAVCQEWLLGRYGSERVAASIADALDARDIFAFAAASDISEELFIDRRVHSSRIGRTRFARRYWRVLLPLMSAWWRRLDLGEYDIVVTSSHAVVNSIRVRRDALHISYCCTPMRYAWMWRSELRRFPKVLWPVWPFAAAILRHGDRRRSRNVDVFVALSTDVAQRIERWYGRESVIVHPPVDTMFFHPDPSVEREPFFLFAGRLIAYKRPDLAVRAAKEAGVPLVIAGGGSEINRLRRMGGPTVRFVEAPSDERLRDLYRRATALVFPGVEDFGIVMVEAQACGTPVIALGEGGAVDSVRNGETGVLYQGESASALAGVLRGFDVSRYDPLVIRRHAERFSIDAFQRSIRDVIEQSVKGREAHV